MGENKICADAGICGGCTYQEIPYTDELKLKEEMVLKLLANAGIGGYEYLGIEGGAPVGYRNKMEFSFGDVGKGGDLALGIRKRRSFYEVVTPVDCNIIDDDFRRITTAVLEFFKSSGESFYHKRTHHGSLRHLVVRKAYFTGEILINLVTTDALRAEPETFAKLIMELDLDGKIMGILHTINNSVADSVKCEDLRVLYGQDFFTERLLGLKFKISAFSFFQTNSSGAEKLYRTVRDFAGDLTDKTLLDLYCGTGTIAQILGRARNVVGIELVDEAVEAARENARLNSLDNCEFIAGDVLKVLEGLPRPELIVLDPPREGIHPKALPKVLAKMARDVIYVSCKPSSLVRDLPAFIDKGYSVRKVKLHDLFPRTSHVESVVLLSRAGD